MNSVDHSVLDPLVFDYISCGISDIVNNLWTWVALLTAAVSFWTTIRAVAAGPSSSPPRSSLQRLKIQVPKSGFVLRRDVISTPTPPLVELVPVVDTPKMPASSQIVSDSDDMMTKGKFVTYYREIEEEEVEEERCEEDKENGGAVGEDGGNGWWVAELRLKMREEMGWHRYQDLTAINGNVVRLWDGVRNGDGEISYRNPIICSSLAIW